eukprot:3334104-Pleurochrysis_carterae.AAC.1
MRFGRLGIGRWGVVRAIAGWRAACCISGHRSVGGGTASRLRVGRRSVRVWSSRGQDTGKQKVEVRRVGRGASGRPQAVAFLVPPRNRDMGAMVAAKVGQREE